ncbi:MAG: B12-binding domain-containing radical SAM protein [Candidatus Hydrogenedentota bacterium]
MHVLLINPWITDFAAFDFWMKPYGLLKIKRVLDEKGMETSFLDCLDRYYPGMIFLNERGNGSGKFYKKFIPKPEILKNIPRRYGIYGIYQELVLEFFKSIPHPDKILITSYMTYWYDGVKLIIDLVRKYFNEGPVGLGGIYATLCKEHSEKYSGADQIIIDTTDLGEFLGMDLDVDLHYVIPDYSCYKNIKSYQIRITEGCPFNCSYCVTKLLQPDFISLPIEPVLELIENGVSKGVKDFSFIDDALLYHNDIERFLRALSKFKNARFHLPNAIHARKINHDIAHLLKEANFKTIRLGFETTDTEFQQSSGGKIYTHEIEQAVRYLKKPGFSDIGVYTMYGSPLISKQSVLKTIEFIKQLGLKIFLALYSPVPGSFDFEYSVKKNPQISIEPLLHNCTLSVYDDYDFYTKLSADIRRHNARLLS